MVRNGLRFRKALRWTVGLFALSQVLLAVIVDQAAPSVRDPEYAILESTLKQRIAERPDARVALFVGSSRVTHGFDAARAAGEENVVLFNFGVPGSGPFFQEIMLERLLDAGIKPDILFLELLHPFFNAAGPFSLDHGLLDGARLSAGEARRLLDYGTRSRTGPLRRWVYARLLPAYRHQAEMRDRLGLGVYPEGCNPCSPWRTIDAFGYRPRKEPPRSWPELTALAHQNYDPFFGTFQLDPHPWLRLVRTIAEAHENGTQVVVILMPEGSEFRSLYTTESEAARSEMLRRLREECAVRVVDARAWLDDSAFYDQHHLLPDGAVAFAERFRVEVLQPSLKAHGRPSVGFRN
jgi:Protein of unknown function (DUF1574)